MDIIESNSQGSLVSLIVNGKLKSQGRVGSRISTVEPIDVGGFATSHHQHKQFFIGKIRNVKLNGVCLIASKTCVKPAIVPATRAPASKGTNASVTFVS